MFVENPWPPIIPHMREVKGNLVNVLLEASKKDYHRHKRNLLENEMSHSHRLRDSSACEDTNETLN